MIISSWHKSLQDEETQGELIVSMLLLKEARNQAEIRQSKKGMM
jgi:hypothetical protein